MEVEVAGVAANNFFFFFFFGGSNYEFDTSKNHKTQYKDKDEKIKIFRMKENSRLKELNFAYGFRIQGLGRRLQSKLPIKLSQKL